MTASPSTLTSWRVGGQLDPAWLASAIPWTHVRATATLSRPADGAPVVDPTNGAHEHPLTVVNILTAARADGQWATAPLKPTTSTGADLALAPSGLTWEITLEIKRGATWHEVITYEVAPSGDRDYDGEGELITVDGDDCIDINALIPPPAAIPPGELFSDAVLEVLTDNPSAVAADLSVSRNGTTVTVASSTGTDATLPAATTSLAGVLTATDKTKLDATSGTNTGDQATRLYPYLKATDGTLNTAIAADFAAGRLAIGDAIQTAAYWQGLRHGGNTYHLVAAATGTVDGGTYINGTGYQLRAVSPGRPTVTQFGAKGDGTTDDTAAIQAAVNAAIATGARTAFFPLAGGQRYRLGSTVTIASSGFALEGDATPVNNPQSGGHIFADSGVTTMFDYGGGSGSHATNQFVVSGLAFYGSASVNQTAIKITQNNNGPHRGFLMRACCGTRLANVMLFDIPTSGYLAGASLTVEACVFWYNTNVVNAVERLLGLRFVGNQSEQGARITGNLDSGITIEDNMLEGQTDTISVDGGQPLVSVRNNYFEGNTGQFILRVKASSSASRLIIGRNNISSQPADDVADIVRLEGSLTVIEDERFIHQGTRKAELTSLGATIVAGSRVRGRFYVGTTNDTGVSGFTDPRPLRGFIPSTAVVSSSLGSTTLVTPFGVTTTGVNAGSFSGNGYLSLTKTWSAGDILVACALVRAEANGSEIPSIYFYDGAYSNIDEMGQQTFSIATGDEWYVMFTTILAASSGTTFRFRFGANGVSAASTTLGVAAIGVDVVPAASFVTFNSAERAYVRLFNPFV